ncbi:hypothetical protein DL93DRAFT_1667774 [Clavulina sp. PMI_390]|nr:hypothetical protein DL93DRAFT_1667774 [Clavulina sp. PMI_390]
MIMAEHTPSAVGSHAPSLPHLTKLFLREDACRLFLHVSHVPTLIDLTLSNCSSPFTEVLQELDSSNKLQKLTIQGFWNIPRVRRNRLTGEDVQFIFGLEMFPHLEMFSSDVWSDDSLGALSLLAEPRMTGEATSDLLVNPPPTISTEPDLNSSWPCPTLSSLEIGGGLPLSNLLSTSEPFLESLAAITKTRARSTRSRLQIYIDGPFILDVTEKNGNLVAWPAVHVHSTIQWLDDEDMESEPDTEPDEMDEEPDWDASETDDSD